jgi:hypothetical protein
MIKKGLIITENDRQNILSMYGILSEEVIPKITVSGTVTNENSEGVQGVVVSIFLPNLQKKVVTDFDGNFTFILSNIQEDKYILNANHPNYEFPSQNLNIIKSQIDYTVKFNGKNIKLKELEEVQVLAYSLTNLEIKVIKDEKEVISDYKLKLKSNSKKDFLYERDVNQDILSLSFLKGDVLLEKNKNYSEEDIKGKPENVFYYEIGKSGEKIQTPDKQITVIIENEKIGKVKKEFTIKIKNSSANITKEGNKYYTIDKLNFKLFENKKNDIIINVKSPNLRLVVKDSNNQPIEGANVNFINKDINLITNSEGIVVLEKLNLGDVIGYTVEKDEYRSSKYSEVNIDENEIIKKVVLKSLSEDSELTGERKDDFKNTLFSIYGRGKSKTSVQEAIRMAKIDIVNSYLKKHKKNFSGIPEFTNQDINIPVELAYQRDPSVVEKNRGEESVIYKAKKKDVKNFLKKISTENNIEIIEPLEFENITLKDALRTAFLNGKNVFVLLGKTTEPYTVDTMKKINSSNDASQKISKGYVPIFIPVDTSNENYNYLYTLLSQNRASGQSKIIPRSILFKPLDTVGNKAELIRQIDYTMFKDDINKIV